MQEEFYAGRALVRGCLIWGRNLAPFLLLTTLVYAPLVLYKAWALHGDLTEEGLVQMQVTSAVLGAALNLIVTAALLYGVVRQLRGQHASLIQCVSVGLRRLLPVFAVGLVSALPFVLAGVIALVVPAAMVVLLVPMIVYYLMIYVAVPAAVIERPGVLGALRRSMTLTRGYKGQIFGMLFLLGVAIWVITFLLRSPYVEDGQFKSMADFKAFTWIEILIDIASASLLASINGVVYHDLRAAKDGVATDDLARVFE